MQRATLGYLYPVMPVIFPYLQLKDLLILRVINKLMTECTAGVYENYRDLIHSMQILHKIINTPPEELKCKRTLNLMADTSIAIGLTGTVSVTTIWLMEEAVRIELDLFEALKQWQNYNFTYNNMTIDCVHYLENNNVTTASNYEYPAINYVSCDQVSDSNFNFTLPSDNPYQYNVSQCDDYFNDLKSATCENYTEWLLIPGILAMIFFLLCGSRCNNSQNRYSTSGLSTLSSEKFKPLKTAYSLFVQDKTDMALRESDPAHTYRELTEASSKIKITFITPRHLEEKQGKTKPWKYFSLFELTKQRSDIHVVEIKEEKSKKKTKDSVELSKPLLTENSRIGLYSN